jgi:hypothetical protein
MGPSSSQPGTYTPALPGAGDDNARVVGASDDRQAARKSGWKGSGRLRVTGLVVVLAVAASLVVGIVWARLGGPSSQSQSLLSVTLPIRAAFYYPWFPEAWQQQGLDPFSHYKPSLGYYAVDAATVSQQIKAMKYANIRAGIASWWGQGSATDGRISILLDAAARTGFEWALYYEPEGQGDPSPSQIANDLKYIQQRYTRQAGYLRVGGRPVLFAYADSADGCGMAERWKQANTLGFYVVLKVFSGYRACSNQPDSWHQYAPAGAEGSQTGFSFTISPAFWKASEPTPRLSRDLSQWSKSVTDMVASKAPWQLVTTFNEWGEGTAVEDSVAWQSASGYGAYLDVLHDAR